MDMNLNLNEGVDERRIREEEEVREEDDEVASLRSVFCLAFEYIDRDRFFSTISSIYTYGYWEKTAVPYIQNTKSQTQVQVHKCTT